MPSDIKFETNIDEVIKQLRRAGIAIQEAGADAMNMGAAHVAGRYKKDLKNKKRLRNQKFSLGSVAILKAHAKRSDQTTIRKMEDINAIVGIRQLRNGMHYLATMEIGGQKRGNSKTGRKVPIPMTKARQSGNIDKPIASKYRLSGNTQVNQYQSILRNSTNVRQQYAILNSLARSGRIKSGMYQSDDYIYSVTPKQVTMIRRVKENVTIKPSPLFEGATGTVSQAMLDRFFLISSNKRIRAIK